MENYENEVFKTVEGHNGIYMCSNYGRVKSIERFRKGKNNSNVFVEEKFLTPKIDSDGYLAYQLSLGVHKKTKYYRANILVYKTFIGDIPYGFDVHHINEDKMDNRPQNLELKEHKKHTKDHKEKYKKKVVQYTLNNEFVSEYQSIAEASKQTKIDRHSISACCNNIIKNGYVVKTAGGYIWKFKEAA